jgi:hypothetical protein
MNEDKPSRNFASGSGIVVYLTVTVHVNKF